MLAGDKQARGEALQTLHEFEKLIKKAGGRNLHEEWRDRGLTSLNRKILNAYGPYFGCLMYGSLGGQCTYPAKLAREASDAYRYLRSDAQRSPRR